jgi:ankyrin repeat protein
MEAAWQGHLQVASLLLEGGANLNARSQLGRTALMKAAGDGHPGVVKLLLDKAADANGKDTSGKTVLMYAATFGDHDVVKLLLDRGAKINSREDTGWTSLMHAAAGGNVEVVNLLLEEGAEVDATDNYGRTALMKAAYSGQPDVVRLLVNRGADVNRVDANGWTALRHSKVQGQEEITQLLKGAPVRPGTPLTSAERYPGAGTDSRPKSYPVSPAGVVEAFVKSALRDLPVTVEEMRSCADIFAVQSKYLPKQEDIRYNRKTLVMAPSERWGPSWSRLHIAKDFEIKEVQEDANRATVKVLYKRLGWVWNIPIEITECRSSAAAKDRQEARPRGLLEAVIKHDGKQKGWVWDKDGCRFLHITNDTQEVTYSLAKPGKFWRIIHSYEPSISVSSAIKFLECLMRTQPGVSSTYPSDEQAIQIKQDIRMLERHLSN